MEIEEKKAGRPRMFTEEEIRMRNRLRSRLQYEKNRDARLEQVREYNERNREVINTKRMERYYTAKH